MAAKRNLSTFVVAEMLGVDPSSVANWIDGGALRAYRTPGGHRRVSVDDLLAFLREHEMPIPPELREAPLRVVVVHGDPRASGRVARAVRTARPDCEVTEANDGFRAGATVATVKPDVVILDLQTPGMDGLEVCRMIKSQPSTRHARVIAVTAHPSEDSRRAVKCGAEKCLAKSVGPEELAAEVEAALRRSGEGPGAPPES